MSKFLVIEAGQRDNILKQMIRIVQDILTKEYIDIDFISIADPLYIATAATIALEEHEYEGIVALGIIDDYEDQRLVLQECYKTMNEVGITYSAAIGTGVCIQKDQALFVAKKAALSSISLYRVKQQYIALQQIDKEANYEH